MIQEKRHFQRVGIYMSGQLTTDQGESMDVEVLDLSLQGVRVNLQSEIPDFPASHNVVLSFQANEDSPPITLTGIITRQIQSPESLQAGIKITHIAVDDLGALRRFLLFNSGQADLDDAELEALVNKITAALASN